MSGDFVDFQWSGWKDDVGCKFNGEIQNGLYTLETVHQVFENDLKNAEEVLTHQEAYTSQRTVISSLEVR